MKNDKTLKFSLSNNVKNYDEGIVCFIDILGFNDFIKHTNIENLTKLYDRLINVLQAIKFLNYFNISIFSDSILLTLKVKKEKNGEQEYCNILKYLIYYVVHFRDIVVDSVKTDIRVGICYGEFIHISNNDLTRNMSKYKSEVYFGPAIIHAHKLAEKNDEFESLKRFAKNEIGKDIFSLRPAAILIDFDSFKRTISNNINFNFELNNLKLDEYTYCTDDILLINPYIYNVFSYINDEHFTEQEVVNKIKRIIDKHHEILKKKEILQPTDLININEKYALDILFFNDFIDYIKSTNHIIKDIDSYFIKSKYIKL